MPIPKLKNTTWIVPKINLLAYKFNDNEYEGVIDQTVWKINDQNKNYFFGYAYANVKGVYTKSYLVGSILNDKSVQINFQNVSENTVIIGYGKYIDGEFQMQMITNNTKINSNLIHASFMIGVKPYDKNYKKLPGSKSFNNGKYLSVDEFIKKCDESI